MAKTLPHYAVEIRDKTVSEVLNAQFSFDLELRSTELLTGTPTITEVTSSDLTITNKLVSASELSISGRTVAIGRAITFTVSGGVAKTSYVINCIVDTDAGQTLVGNVRLNALADT